MPGFAGTIRPMESRDGYEKRRSTDGYLRACWGAWLGGWCWQEVTRSLRQAGHEVHLVTLTGLGERAHVASRDVDLETHITDVVNLAELEDLREMILLGHSTRG